MFSSLRNACISVEPLSTPIMVSRALEQFAASRDIDLLPVVEGGALKALYFKDCIPFILGCENGRACKSYLPSEVVREMPSLDIRAGEKASMEALKEAVKGESSLALFAERLFLGIVPLKQLMLFIHKNEIKEAITLNPLTGLPGNYSIEKEFERRVGREPFVVCYVDINDFKVYNDQYGITQGDEIIKYTAYVLGEACKGHFVGHVGGDDFILMLPESGAAEVFQRVGATFDNRVPSFYSERHRELGYVTAKDRQGVIRKFGFMHLSMAAMVIKEKCNFQEVTASLASLKAYVKTESKSKGQSFHAFDKRKVGGKAS
ncbi:MAG: diguanylate cyclase [Alphaproteobacteria bacterium]|uniref:diguanylate cyclase n=1 Tax=Candidatus Nitrobium versatile TaxID=2884831 RepID=A0A953M218_9BACT|nr:diguanylate cyclase [Candidatus Nitrobium versatile]